jgi:hypothetical protein
LHQFGVAQWRPVPRIQTYRRLRLWRESVCVLLFKHELTKSRERPLSQALAPRKLTTLANIDDDVCTALNKEWNAGFLDYPQQIHNQKTLAEFDRRHLRRNAFNRVRELILVAPPRFARPATHETGV